MPLLAFCYLATIQYESRTYSHPKTNPRSPYVFSFSIIRDEASVK